MIGKKGNAKPLALLFFSINEIFIRYFENFRKCFDFNISNKALIGFNSCNYILVHIIAAQLKLMGKHPLGHMVFLTKLDESFTD